MDMLLDKLEEFAEKNRKEASEMLGKRIKALEDTYFKVPGIVGN